MEGIQRIVIPIDKSDSARIATDRGAQFAKLIGVEVAIIYVSDSQQYIASSALEDRLRQENERVLSEFRQIVEAREVGVSSHLLSGMNAADEIIKFINDGDLIVMASHNKKGFDRFILGSVTEELLRRAPSTMLIFKPGMPNDHTPL